MFLFLWWQHRNLDLLSKNPVEIFFKVKHYNSKYCSIYYWWYKSQYFVNDVILVSVWISTHYITCIGIRPGADFLCACNPPPFCTVILMTCIYDSHTAIAKYIWPFSDRYLPALYACNATTKSTEYPCNFIRNSLSSEISAVSHSIQTKVSDSRCDL